MLALVAVEGQGEPGHLVEIVCEGRLLLVQAGACNDGRRLGLGLASHPYISVYLPQTAIHSTPTDLAKTTSKGLPSALSRV